MFGESNKTPTFEGAHRVFVEPSRETRHDLIINFTIFLLKTLNEQKRISIYTRDSVLKNRIEKEILVTDKIRIAFFRVFFIKDSHFDNCTFTNSFEYEEPGNLSNDNVFSDNISGSWVGTWAREKGRINHSGQMNIIKTGTQLDAKLLVNFNRNDVRTELEEHLEGIIIKGQAFYHVFLWGISYSYLIRGASKTYLLDGFHLTTINFRSITGDFISKSKKGEGSTQFDKILPIN